MALTPIPLYFITLNSVNVGLWVEQSPLDHYIVIDWGDQASQHPINSDRPLFLSLAQWLGLKLFELLGDGLIDCFVKGRDLNFVPYCNQGNQSAMIAVIDDMRSSRQYQLSKIGDRWVGIAYPDQIGCDFEAKNHKVAIITFMGAIAFHHLNVSLEDVKSVL